MPSAYYNEFDKHAAAWLRELIRRGLIAPGEVDERSILEVKPDDLRGFTQCHFFAGIGGWSYALRLAGWPDDRPVWTGSCPCQPFSVAGKQAGSGDERHLWPAFFGLISECRPVAVFGEQVASALGRAWLDHVCADLESAGYAAAAANLPACCVGAPHIRQRLWFVANAEGAARQISVQQRGSQPEGADLRRASGIGILADSQRRPAERHGPELASEARGMQGEARQQRIRHDVGNGDAVGGMGNAEQPGMEGFAGDGGNQNEPGRLGTDTIGPVAEAGPSYPWRELAWLPCRDGKTRPTQPGLFPLVNGISDGRLAIGRAVQQSYAALSQEESEHRFNKVGVLRGAGNAIVPQVAAKVIGAYMDICHA